MNQKMKKLLLLNLPYVLIGLFCTNVGEAWRIATGADLGTKIISFCGSMGAAWSNPMPIKTVKHTITELDRSKIEEQKKSRPRRVRHRHHPLRPRHLRQGRQGAAQRIAEPE